MRRRRRNASLACNARPRKSVCAWPRKRVAATKNSASRMPKTRSAVRKKIARPRKRQRSSARLTRKPPRLQRPRRPKRLLMT
jgi:hypothetical protein